MKKYLEWMQKTGGQVGELSLVGWLGAALLVRRDTGRRLRESDLRAGGDANRYVVWDTAAGAPVVIGTARLGMPAGVTAALDGTYAIRTADGTVVVFRPRTGHLTKGTAYQRFGHWWQTTRTGGPGRYSWADVLAMNSLREKSPKAMAVCMSIAASHPPGARAAWSIAPAKFRRSKSSCGLIVTAPPPRGARSITSVRTLRCAQAMLAWNRSLIA